MRVDNHGEGGIMALMALLAGQNKKRSAIVAFRARLRADLCRHRELAHDDRNDRSHTDFPKVG